MTSSETQPEVVALRHDWYQTETHVVVTVLQKSIPANTLKVDCSSKELKVQFGELKNPFVFRLAHDVDGDKLTTKLTANKLEIKLPKKEVIQWRKLEGEDPVIAKPIPKEAGTVSETKPSTGKNWDAVVKGEEIEEVDPLNTLFRKIYSEGSDEVRKAMVKSFQESGGTVLSTNWDQVGQSKVDVKPPDGTEFRKWD